MTASLAAIPLSSTALAAGLAADPSLGQTAQGIQWGGGPVFPPLVSGTKADIAANFVGGQYQAAGANQTSFSAWLAALGGTFSRGTPATYIDGGVIKTAAVNVPRLGSFGLRLTGGVTNLARYSNGFAASGTAWAALGGSVAAANVIAPDSTNNSWLHVPDTTNGGHIVYEGLGGIVAGYLTGSCFFKNAGYNYGCVSIVDPGGNRYSAVVDLTTGAVTATNIVGSPTSMLNGVALLGNGWVLVSVSMAATGSGTGFIQLSSSNVAVPTGWLNNTPTFVGDGVSGVYMFGAQFTQTPFLCDYIPVPGATAVAQNADNLYFPYSHTTFSVLAGTNGLGPSTGSGLVVVGEQTTGVTPIYLGIGAFSTWNSTAGIAAPIFSGTSYSPHKTMAAGSPSGRAVTTDGATPVSDANAFATSFAQMALGSYSSGSQAMFGNLSQLAVWTNIVAPPSEMQRLTT